MRIAVAVLLVSLVEVAVAQVPGKPSVVAGEVESENLIGIEFGGGLTLDDVAPVALVTKVDPAGPWYALGVRTGDVIVAVDGEAIARSTQVPQKAIGLRYKAVAYVEVMRKKKPLLLRTRVTEPTPPPLVADPTPGAADAELDKLIKQTGPATWEVDADALLADPMKFTRGARVVPSVKNGKPNGFKLYAIRPSSMWVRLGFSNGDTIHSVNGMAITSMDKALEVYTSVRDADKLVVEITRRGKPVTNTYVRRQPAEKL